MDAEMELHCQCGMGTLVDLPEGHKPIGCCWVYMLKMDEHESFIKAKGHIIVQGMTQIPDIDYYDITLPVSQFDSLQMLLAIRMILDWEIGMIHVKGPRGILACDSGGGYLYEAASWI